LILQDKMAYKKISGLSFVIASLLLSVMTSGFVMAYDTSNPYTVTLNWIVPSDTTFTVALAGAETTIDFNPINKSSLEVQADSQADVTPIVTITNQGNILADYSAEVTGTLPSWVTLKGKNSYDYSTADTLSNSTNITIQANVEGGDTAEYWLWSDFTEAPKGTEESSFQISTLETP
jgi:hypothetical protein